MSESGSKWHRVEFANGLRAVAVACVLLSHYVGVFWIGRETVSQLGNTPLLPYQQFNPPFYLNAILAAFTRFTSPGLFGVSLFFLVSGFVIPFSFERGSTRGFLLGRAFRIFPTYAAGLAVTVLSLFGASRVFGLAFPYTARAVLVQLFPGFSDFLDSPGLDGVVWSLHIEIKFYLLCAIFGLGLRRSSLRVLWVPVVAAAAILIINPIMWSWDTTYPTLYRAISVLELSGIYFCYMFIGVAYHYLYRGVISRQRFAALAALYFFLFVLAQACSVHAHQIRHSVDAALALGVFLGSAVLAERRWKSRPLAFMSRISYPVYACHSVFGYAALRILIGNGVPVIISYVLTVGCVILIGWSIHLWIESPMQKLGRRAAQAW